MPKIGLRQDERKELDMFKRLVFLPLVASAIFPLMCLSADLPSDYPTKPIELIVPYPPGGSVDTLSRIISPKASELLKQSVVVVNKPGAGGALGLDFVAKAKPDGYTLVGASITVSIIKAVMPDIGFDPIKDFSPISNLITQANILVVNSASKFDSLSSYIEFGKKNPGKITFGSAGVGGSSHLSGEMLKVYSNIDISHVPYKGNGPAILALLGGHIDSAFVNIPDCIEHIRGGKLRGLAVTTQTRVPDLPNVPTFVESGIPKYDVTSWIGVSAPAKTHPRIVEKLGDVFRLVLQDSTTVNKLKSLGFMITYKPPKEFETWIKSDYDRYTDLIKRANIKL
jgi:tripartite-type tricarboxylate transporter receptor subunit TctC